MTKEEFDEFRRSAFAIAYRMLGGVNEAGRWRASSATTTSPPA